MDERKRLEPVVAGERYKPIYGVDRALFYISFSSVRQFLSTNKLNQHCLINVCLHTVRGCSMAINNMNIIL